MNDVYKLGLRGKTTFVLGGLIFLVLIVTSFTSYWQSQNVAEQKVIELEQSKFSVLKHEIEGALNNHRKNLLSLHDVPPIQAIIRARANNSIDPKNGNTLQEWRNRLKTIFGAFLANHPEYQQIRYIAAAGDELVRVQAGADGEVIVVADDKLQNKSDSLYVSETLKLKAGEAYYSDVTLNQEHGVIQVPHLPVLRLASPVHDTHGQVAALIVINLATERLFNDVGSEANGVQRNIVDEEGYYIKHSDSDKTFGLERAIDYRFQTVEPDLAEIATHQDHFMRRDDDDKELDGFQKIYFSPQDRSRYWLLTLHIPEDVVFAGVAKALNQMLFFSLLMGLFSLLLIVWFISRKILTPVVDLATAASRLQAGDLTVRVDATSARDEFHTLYAAINAFAENQQLATAQLENKVAVQTKRLSAVIDNIVDGIITISERGTVESFNPAARRIFGYSDAEVIGQNVKMLMPEPYHSEHDGYLEHHIKTGEKKVIGIGRELIGRRKDGTTFPMELAVSEVIIDSVRHFVGITRDISERKKVEQMKAEFISTVSHELRTPLTSIRGALGLVLGKAAMQLPEKARRMLEMAERNSERLTLLINDILDLEKIEAGRLEFDFRIVDLAALAARALEDNEGYASKHQVRLVLDRQVTQASVRADEHRLLQVFSNLISNAVKYSLKDSTVDVCVAAHGSGFRVAVRDYGAGIPQEFRRRIFQRFAQADSSDTRDKGGTGLGLSITKAIVERHDGDIGYETEVGVGTVFYFDLPAWQAVTESDKAVPGIRILICEDNPDVARILVDMLEPEGLVCDIAGSAAGARTLLGQNAYRLMLLDLTLPDADGLKFLQELREDPGTAQLPVIVVSGRAHEGQAAFSGDAVAVIDWIQKPVDKKRLEQALQEALHRVARPCILHVEDDPDIVQVTEVLLEELADVTHVSSLYAARQVMVDESFDLVILDLGLTDGSGLDLLDELKGRCPVVIFSAQIPDRTVTDQVVAALTKSVTSNEQLLATIKHSLNMKEETDR